MSEIILTLVVLSLIVGVIILLLILKRTSPDLRGQLERVLREEFREERNELNREARQLREDLASRSKELIDTVVNALSGLGQSVSNTLQHTTQELKGLSDSIQVQLDRQRGAVDAGLKSVNDATLRSLEEISKLQKSQLELVVSQIKDLTHSSQTQMDALRKTVEGQLERVRTDNESKLEQIRVTVDEKLQHTLDRRLVESFKTVQHNLESVQQGLGEMRSLAMGVGDLKKVLANVKARGTWGEVQLGSILEQILAPGQYAKNVQTKEGSQDAVEYAIKLPGQDGSENTCVWLPIDSKFPQEDYARLVDASEAGDAVAVQQALLSLARVARLAAQKIRDKYLDPPKTTDIAIMFLPTEGLYAEMLRQGDLVGELQRTYRVVPAGPTNLAAILSSFRMGFQTLAIEKRSSEVWKVLAAVKTEFSKFGGTLEKLKRKLEEASKTVEDTDVRTRVMQRKLREVEQLPPETAQTVLRLSEPQEAIEMSDENAQENVEDAPF